MDVRLEQRVNIKFCVKLGKTATETLQILRHAYGDEALSRARVFGWHRRFILGRVSVEDDTRSGRLSSSRNEDNVVRIRDMIREGRTVAVRMLADAPHINKWTCHQILREDLDKRKLNARLVPHTLTQDQKEVRASICADLLHEAQNDATFVNNIIAEDESWCSQYDPQTKRQSAEWRSTGTPPSKKVRQQSSTTNMMIIFFSTPGVLFITNLSRKGKRSTKKFTSSYSGACARHFDVVVLTCGHLDSGFYCTTMRDHTQI